MRGSTSGERRGGRQKGVPNRKTAAKVEAIEASGLTPLDFMLQVLRDENAAKDDRMWAAEKAAPYVHPKLATIAHTGADGGPMVVEFKTIYEEKA